ncbi:M20 family metallopeptidase [Nonomuraea sp. NPDC004702]
MPWRMLYAPDGERAGLVIEIEGGHPGPTWVLDACLDTAPFGDESAWSFSPTAGDIVDGWLRGRGAADSKTAAAMFCHIAAALLPRAQDLHGRLAVLFDVDEHTGAFGGATAFLDNPGPAPVAGVMIGYPGLEEVVLGGRGVFRAHLRVHGIAGHFGASKPAAANAISRAVHLITGLEDAIPPRTASSRFPQPPKLTITQIHGGESFTAVPDHCTVSIDIRLTDAFHVDDAKELLRLASENLDSGFPAPQPTTIEPVLAWPPFCLTPADQPAAALLSGAEAAGILVHPKIAGPSNIGNFLATRSIPSTAGFGLAYQGLHGTDEQVRLGELPAVHAAYHHAVLTLLSACS